MKTLLALTLLSSVAVAQQQPMELKTEKITEGLWLISGPGGNIAVSIGKDGVFLVDDQIPPMAPKLIAEVAKLDKRPVRFVVNTHWHHDHVGGNEKLGESGAVLIAQDNVRKRMAAGQFMAMMKKQIPPAPHVALPVVTFADSISLHLNDEDVDVLHQPPGHTDGDSIVWFHKLDVIHAGDDYVSGYPIVDGSSGGQCEGIIAATGKVLELAGPKTKIIPGHGAITDKVKLKAWHDMVATICERVKKQVAAGKTVSEIINSKPTAEFDAEWGNGFMKPPMLIEMLWHSYKK